MIKFSVGSYLIQVENGPSSPQDVDYYRRSAALVDEFDLQNTDRSRCFVSVSRKNDWPELVVLQTYSPSLPGGFEPGLLLVPETETLFIGAGIRLLAYRLNPLQRLWEDTCDTGFWHWRQFGNVILMSAELELAAWDSSGRKLWSMFVEPPWGYEVHVDRVLLDVMGVKSEFDLQHGPMSR